MARAALVLQHRWCFRVRKGEREMKTKTKTKKRRGRNDFINSWQPTPPRWGGSEQGPGPRAPMPQGESHSTRLTVSSGHREQPQPCSAAASVQRCSFASQCSYPILHSDGIRRANLGQHFQLYLWVMPSPALLLPATLSGWDAARTPEKAQFNPQTLFSHVNS